MKAVLRSDPPLSHKFWKNISGEHTLKINTLSMLKAKPVVREQANHLYGRMGCQIFEIERVLTGKTFSSQTVEDGATFSCLGQNSSSIFDKAQRSVESDKGEVQSSTRHKLSYEISSILET
jgi:hypothetical protein